MREFLNTWFNRAMTENDVNSRIIYLGHGVITGIGIIALLVGFMVAHNKELYPTMLIALSGGGFGAAASRMLTKFGNKAAGSSSQEGVKNGN